MDEKHKKQDDYKDKMDETKGGGNFSRNPGGGKNRKSFFDTAGLIVNSSLRNISAGYAAPVR